MDFVTHKLSEVSIINTPLTQGGYVRESDITDVSQTSYEYRQIARIVNTTQTGHEISYYTEIEAETFLQQRIHNGKPVDYLHNDEVMHGTIQNVVNLEKLVKTYTIDRRNEFPKSDLLGIIDSRLVPIEVCKAPSNNIRYDKQIDPHNLSLLFRSVPGLFDFLHKEFGNVDLSIQKGTYLLPGIPRNYEWVNALKAYPVDLINPNGTFSHALNRHIQFPDQQESPYAAFQVFESHYHVLHEYRKSVDSLYGYLGIDKPSAVTKLLQTRTLPDVFKAFYPEFQDINQATLEVPFRWDEIMQTLFIALASVNNFQKPYYEKFQKFFINKPELRDIPRLITHLYERFVPKKLR